MTRPATIPFRVIEINLASGSDAQVIERHDFTDGTADFGEYPDCPSNPHSTGCHFDNPFDPDAPCIYCKKPGGQ